MLDRVLGDRVAQFVGGAQGHARLDAAARHPDAKTLGMMVAAQELRSAARLIHRRAAEFATPNHQGFVQQPSPLQVREQCGDRPVDILALLG